MKTLLVLVLTVGAYSAFADHHEEKFEEVKAKMSANIEKRISHMQEAKACVDAAKDKDAIKVCRDKMQAHRKEMKEEWKKRKEEHTANKMNKQKK